MKTCRYCRKKIPEKEKICRYCDYEIPEGQISPWQTGFVVLPVAAIPSVKPLPSGFQKEIDDEEDE